MLRAWFLLWKKQDRFITYCNYIKTLSNSENQLLEGLEALYSKYNKRKFVHPDPLEFLYLFKDPKEREVAGLIAASLAYGRVSQILKSISICLQKMEKRPRAFLLSHSPTDIEKVFSDFNYRFTKAWEMTRFLIGLKGLIERYDTLEKAFLKAGQVQENQPCLVVKRLSAFVSALLGIAGLEKSYLLPDPRKKSACKRLFLFLRWMVRSDQVDPGGWTCLSPRDLLIPLDTHMFNIARDIGLTGRKQADLNTAIEITEAFRNLNPEDPVKYDFVLTRFGIRRELSRKDIPHLLSRS